MPARGLPSPHGVEPGLLDHWTLDGSGKKLTESHLFHIVTGRPATDALRYGYLRAVAESDRDDFLSFLTQIEPGGRRLETSIVVLTADERAALLTTVSAPEFKDGKLFRVTGVTALRWLV